MPSVWAKFNHVLEVFQGLFFTFLLLQKDALRARLRNVNEILDGNNEYCDVNLVKKVYLEMLANFELD